MTVLNTNSNLGKLAKDCNTDTQKIDFFDFHHEVFVPVKTDDFSFPDDVSKEIDDAFYVYANMKRMTENELNELRKLNWKNYPPNFKIFLVDFCFLTTN